MKKIQPIATGAYKLGETKDCTVRALANASNMLYHEAHEILKKHGRKDRHGCFDRHWTPAYLESGFICKGAFGTTIKAVHFARDFNVPQYKGMNLKKAMQVFSEGRYIFMIRGHAMAVIDGELIDTAGVLENSYVSVVFQFKEH